MNITLIKIAFNSLSKGGVLIHNFFYCVIVLIIIRHTLNITDIYSAIWLLIYVSTFLALESLFKQEIIDGKMDLIYLSSFSLYFYCWVRYLLHWLLLTLPFILLISFIYSFNYHEVISLMLGSFCFILLGGLNYLFIFGSYEIVMLTSLMVFPFLIPIFIYGIEKEFVVLQRIGIVMFIIIPYLTSWSICNRYK